MAGDDPGTGAGAEVSTADESTTSFPELDDTLVRTTVEEVKAIAQRAHNVEIALVATAAVLMVMVAGFTGFNTYRLREVNANLTEVVETLEANQSALQIYNEEHAVATAESHSTLAHNLLCMSDFFQASAVALRRDTPLPDKATLDACFEQTKPPPGPMPLPGDKKRDGEG